MKRLLAICFLFLAASCARSQTWSDAYTFTQTFSGGGSTDFVNTLTLMLTTNTNGGLTWHLPASNGTAHYPFVTDGSGNLSWELLQIAGGGTGRSSVANGSMLFKSPSSATQLQEVTIGTTGQLLGVSGGNPLFITANAVNITAAVLNNPDGTTSTTHNRITPTVDAVPLWLQSFAAGSANLLNAIYDNGAGTNTVLTLGSTGALTLTPAADVGPITITQFGGGTSDALTIDGSAIITHNLNLNAPGGSIDIGSATQQGTLALWDNANGFAQDITTQALSGFINFDLPPNEGSSGDVLTTNGLGILSWAAPASGGVSSFSAGTTGFTPNTATTGAVTLAGTLVAANGGTGATSLTGVVHGNGTSAMTASNVNLTSEVTGTLPIGNGGTGQTTASAAFNALSPTTTDGDISYRNSTTNTRLAAGSAYYPLVIDHVSGRPAWQQLRLDQGVQNILPSVNGGTGIDGSAVTDGQLLIGQTSDNSFGLATITAGSGISVTNAGHSITIASIVSPGMSNPMTTLGDMIYASNTATPATPARLGIGASTTVLHGGTTPSYSQIVNGDITNSTIDLTAKVTGTLPYAQGGTGATSLTTNAMLYAGASAITATGAPTNGQLLIGSTSAAPALGTLTAGSGITITNGAGAITIAGSTTTTNDTLTPQLTIVGGTYAKDTGSFTNISGGVQAAVVGTLANPLVTTQTVPVLTTSQEDANSPTVGPGTDAFIDSTTKFNGAWKAAINNTAATGIGNGKGGSFNYALPSYLTSVTSRIEMVASSSGTVTLTGNANAGFDSTITDSRVSTGSIVICTSEQSGVGAGVAGYHVNLTAVGSGSFTTRAFKMQDVINTFPNFARPWWLNYAVFTTAPDNSIVASSHAAQNTTGIAVATLLDTITDASVTASSVILTTVLQNGNSAAGMSYGSAIAPVANWPSGKFIVRLFRTKNNTNMNNNEGATINYVILNAARPKITLSAERFGKATLASGAVTVNTTYAHTNSLIFLTEMPTTTNPAHVYVSSISNGASFTITSTGGTDASTVAWMIAQP